MEQKNPLQQFYFDSGVSPPHCDANSLYKGHVMRGGTMQIPFQCRNVPDNAVFKFATDSPVNDDSLIKREIYHSPLVSKYAYFHVYK